MNRELKIFGFRVTLAAIIAFAVTGLLLGILNEIGKDIYTLIKGMDFKALNIIVDWVVTFLFLKIEINILTVIISIIIAIPTYRFLNRKVFGRLISETIFVENFTSSANFWNLNFWGSANPTKTNRIENGLMIFEATPQEWQHNYEGGAFYDLRAGVQKGLMYSVTCKAKAVTGTNMTFRLWLHDAMGNQSVTTNWDTPPVDNFKIYELRFKATESNAIRIHLHCKSGQGQIIINEVKVVRK